MIQRITCSVQFSRHIQTVQLGSQTYRIRFTYRRRTDSWYIDMWKLDGTAIILGRRMAVKHSPLFGLVDDGDLPGILYVEGPDDATKTDWKRGGRVRILFIPYADIPAASSPDDAPIVTLQ